MIYKTLRRPFLEYNSRLHLPNRIQALSTWYDKIPCSNWLYRFIGSPMISGCIIILFHNVKNVEYFPIVCISNNSRHQGIKKKTICILEIIHFRYCLDNHTSKYQFYLIFLDYICYSNTRFFFLNLIASSFCNSYGSGWIRIRIRTLP